MYCLATVLEVKKYSARISIEGRELDVQCPSHVEESLSSALGTNQILKMNLAYHAKVGVFVNEVEAPQMKLEDVIASAEAIIQSS